MQCDGIKVYTNILVMSMQYHLKSKKNKKHENGCKCKYTNNRMMYMLQLVTKRSSGHQYGYGRRGTNGSLGKTLTLLV